MKILLVALDEASDGDHGFQLSTLFQVARLQNRLNRLLFGFLDEAARVHDHDVRTFEVGRHVGSVAEQCRHHALRVDSVLVATQREQCDAGPISRSGGGELVTYGRDVRRNIRPHRVRRERKDRKVARPHLEMT